MKNLKLSGLVLTALLTLGSTGWAQSDLFGQSRTLVLTVPVKVISSTAISNVVDVHMFGGVVKVDLFCLTNGASQTMTATLSTSPDQTNCTTLANYALATATTIQYTNGTYGTTSLVGTNTYNLPGTVTTPASATAGWASPYLLSAQFTNTGAITVTTPGIYTVGFKSGDSGRYLHILWTPGAGVTNTAVGAVLTGRANYVP